MTVFVASLFLPYTISFDSENESTPQLPPVPDPTPELETQLDLATSQPATRSDQKPVEIRSKRRHMSAFDIPIHTVTRKPLLKYPQTPGATTDNEQIFLRDEVNKPFKLRLPSSKSATRLSTLARLDTHSPGWGKNTNWFQPKSRARDPPPASVLSHPVIQQKASPASSTASIQTHENSRARTISTEKRFTESNYTVEPSYQGNGGLIVALDAATDRGLLPDRTWVGTLGLPTNLLGAKVKKSIEERLDLDFESLVIFVDDNDFNGHYEHYCKTILWPHLHYQIPDHPKSKAYLDHSWKYYVTVNRAFADRIIGQWKRGDKIWIHDYHLLLVAGMIRKAIPDAEIGFYLHVSFPSSEIFRCLPTRTDLLAGMLGANLIAFQAEEYVHHFLQTCGRVLHVEATKSGIILDDGRFVHTNFYPMGIDPNTLQARRQEVEVGHWIQTITEKYKGKRLIVARDKLDHIRGVGKKLLAYEMFLQRYPIFKADVVLIQIATTGCDDPELNTNVSDLVERINSSFSSLTHQPLVFLKQDIDYSQWLALLCCAEAFLISSLREGMNLVGHEFVECQDGSLGNNKHSPLILSEFTGAATVLAKNALLVNPWDYKQCATAIKQALDMDPIEKARRWQGMHDAILRHDAIRWLEECARGLDRAYQDHSIRDCSSVPKLSHAILKNKYDAATKRLIILDFEGTLVSWDDTKSTILSSPQQALDLITELINDHANIVYVMANGSPDELKTVFGSVPQVGLIAENGAYLREYGSSNWRELCDMDKVAAWKDGVKSILRYYTQRVSSSRVEERNTALLFKYDGTDDPDGAQKQAAECANHITDVCLAQGVHAVPIENGICVSHCDINKATALDIVRKKISTDHTDKRDTLPDFLLSIGDARDDEYVFDWAARMKQEGILDVISVAVGQRNTAATCIITQGVTGVLSALGKLTGPSTSTAPSPK